MTKYILKSALVAEIEKLKSIQLSIFSRGETEESCYEALSCISVYNEILSLINTLEVKEVDLEKEIHLWMEDNTCGGYCSANIRETAEHFFELGLKVQKGGKV